LAEFVDVDVDAVSVYVIVRVVVVVRRWRVGEDSEYRAECGGDDAEDLGVGGLFADGEIHFGLAVLALDPISQKWGLFVDVGVLAGWLLLGLLRWWGGRWSGSLDAW